MTAGWRDTKTKNFENNMSQDAGEIESACALRWGSGSEGQSSFVFSTRSGKNARAGNTVSLGSAVHDDNRINGGVTFSELHVGLDLRLDGGHRRYDQVFDIGHIDS